MIEDKIRQARHLLELFGMDEERSNERSALTLLALLRLRPEDDWSEASNPMLGTRALMDWMRDAYGRDYAPNTRETIRRFTLHQFADAVLVMQNPDEPNRPVTSPKWNYQITSEALAVIHAHSTPAFEAVLREYLTIAPGLRDRYAAARELNRIPVTLPGGAAFTLSPGGQNVLLKQMVEEFCPRFTPGGEVLYVGDADAKWPRFQAERLEELGVTVDMHGPMPDLVVYLSDKDWLVLMEAASSHGPVNSSRRRQLATLFSGATPGLVYVSCFPDRREMRRYLHDIAWETEVWCAEDPTHLIHFNGDRFLGPHR